MPVRPVPSRTVQEAKDLTEGKAKMRALFVGVNEYTDAALPPLNFAVQDCKALSEAFEAATDRFPQRQLLTQTSVDEDPCLIELLNSNLNHLLSDLSIKDTFVFYFSGHGALDKLSQKLFLCLPQTQLQDLSNTGLSIELLLKRANASGVGKLVLIIDACHSGSVHFPKGVGLQLPGSRRPSESSTPPDPNFAPKLEAALQAYKPDGGKRFFALISCRATQQSWEVPELKHGVFTYFLIKGLEGEAEDGGGRVDSHNLYKYVEAHTEDYIRTHWGRQQNPDQISSGNPNIILGLSTSSSQLDTGSRGGIGFLENQFRDFVWQLLKEQKDLQDATMRQQMCKFAEQRYLPREQADRLEIDTVQLFNNVLKSYEERTTRCLYERGTQPFPFEDLRTDLFQTYNLLLPNLQPAEAAAIAKFQQQKADYLVKFSREIRQQPSLSPERLQELRSPLLGLGFGERVIESFEAEAWAALEDDQKTYRQAYHEEIYQFLSPDRERLNQLQQELGLGDRIVRLIQSQEDDLCQQHQRDYCQDFARSLHTDLSPAPVQDRRGLGDEIIDCIEAEERAQCDRHKQDYGQRYAHLIRQHLWFLTEHDNELHQVQQQCGLSHAIVEALEAQENIDCDRDKQTYRNTYCNALHQEQPLSPKRLDSLRQLQAEMNLGDAIVGGLQEEARETFDQNWQRYLREYEGMIRQREKLTSVDRERRRQTQQRLGLSDQVANWIAQPADAALARDRKAYSAALDGSMRYPDQEPLVRDFGLGEELLQSLKAEVERAVLRDRNEYGDVLMSELHAAFPLSLEAERRLRQLQSHLRLGDAIVDEVTAIVTSEFERKQKERQQQAERDREAAHRLEEESKQQEERNREEARKLEEERRREEESKREDERTIAPVALPVEPISIARASEPRSVTEALITPVAPLREPPTQTRPWLNSRLAIVALGVVGAIGVAASLFLVRVPEAPKPSPSPSVSVQPRSYQEELKEAKGLKNNKKFSEAIKKAQEIPEPAPESKDAKLLIEDAAKEIQKSAEDLYNQGDLQGAIDTLKKVPQSSSIYSGVQPKIDSWTKDWRTDEGLYKAVEEADKKSDWNRVITEGGKIKHPSWKKKVEPLVQKAREAVKPPVPPQNVDPAPTYAQPAPPQNVDPSSNYPGPANVDPAPTYAQPAPPQNVDPSSNYPRPANVDPVPTYPTPPPRTCRIVDGREVCN